MSFTRSKPAGRQLASPGRFIDSESPVAHPSRRDHAPTVGDQKHESSDAHGQPPTPRVEGWESALPYTFAADEKMAAGELNLVKIAVAAEIG